MDILVDFLLSTNLSMGPLTPASTRDPRAKLDDWFNTRLKAIADSLGEPTVIYEPNWFLQAGTAARWVTGKKTILLLQVSSDHGSAILLWGITNEEFAVLTEMAQTRAKRVASPSYDEVFEQQLLSLIASNPVLFLPKKILRDDLATNTERATLLLTPKLNSPNPSIRCLSAEIALQLGMGLQAVLHLMEDPVDGVRSRVLELLSSFGDESAVKPLIIRLQSEANSFLRGQAAYSLGQIGSPEAIPALLNAFDHDQEYDEQGHSPSSISATALDNILGTNHTRILHDGGFCSMTSNPTDYEVMRSQAMELFGRWKERVV